MKEILVRNPSSNKKYTSATGVVSFVSFRNEKFWAAMNSCFAVKNGEKITGLKLTDEGITATFETEKL